MLPAASILFLSFHVMSLDTKPDRLDRLDRLDRKDPLPRAFSLTNLWAVVCHVMSSRPNPTQPNPDMA